LGVIAHCNVGLTHTTATIDIVLTNDAITVLQTLPALKPPEVAHGGSDEVGRVVWIQYVDASMGEILSVSIWREDLDSVVDARGGDGGFIRVTWARL
jgi:hypothetical protein